MNIKSIAILGLIAVVGAAQAQVFTEWNFNSVPADALSSTGSTVANIGAGSVSLFGGTTATFATAFTTTTASSDPALTDNTGNNITTFAAQGTGSGARGLSFAASTAQNLGYTDIIVEMDIRSSNTSSRWMQFEYTTDGTAFTTAGVANAVFELAGGDLWVNNITFDLSSITAVENNANFGFRVTAVFAPGSSVYTPSNSTSTYGTAGTKRFDMVQVSGQPVPEPATMAVLGLGVAAMARRARRNK